MKKMMIAVCAIALAGMVQAAAVGWTLAGCNNYVGDAYSFFVIGQNGVESSAQIAALCSAGTDVSKYEFGSGVIAGNGSANVTTTASGKTLDAGNSYESFFVLFDGKTATDAANYVLITKDQSANLAKTLGATQSTVTFAGANQGTYVNTASNWSKVGSGVPEPTSGLLLLMGMAALALKRKVA